MRRWLMRLGLVFWLASQCQPSFARHHHEEVGGPPQETGGEIVAIGGVSDILMRPPGKARGSLILLTGGDGELGVEANGSFARQAGNPLIRNRDAFVAQGFNVLLADAGTDPSAAVGTMAAMKRPVTVVGTSRGTLRAAEGLAAGARPDRLVLTSGLLSDASGPSQNVMTIVQDPRLLPPTLVVHHREDGCHVTSPAGVAPFQSWAAGRVKVAWVSGGSEEGNPCKGSAHHGYFGQDETLVALVATFAGR